MKISGQQCNAASIYWAGILTGTFSPPPALDSLIIIEKPNRGMVLQELYSNNPCWPMDFMETLYSLLKEAEDSTQLVLNQEPQGLLKIAADMAGIPSTIFPSMTLIMTFDTYENIILNENEVVNSSELFKRSTDELDTLRAGLGHMNEPNPKGLRTKIKFFSDRDDSINLGDQSSSNLSLFN